MSFVIQTEPTTNDAKIHFNNAWIFCKEIKCKNFILGALATQLENENHLDYAGMCCLSVAKCEQSLANLPGETAALVRASRLFLQAEKNVYKLDCPSFEESLNVSYCIAMWSC